MSRFTLSVKKRNCGRCLNWRAEFLRIYRKYFDRLHCVKSVQIRYFFVRVFLYSDWIRRFTPYISIFSPNTGEYKPEKTPYLDTFHAMQIFYKFLLIFMLLELQIIPRIRSYFMVVHPSYVCHSFHPSICLSIHPFVHHVISGTVFFYQHIY